MEGKTHRQGRCFFILPRICSWMPNRQLQYDSLCIFYIVQQYPSVYMQSFIVFAVCKHICMAGGRGEGERERESI